MDLSGLLNSFISKDQLADIAGKAGVSADGATGILSSAASLFANKAADGSVTTSVLESLTGKTDAGSLITSLLGKNGAEEVAQRSGASTTDTNNVLSAVAPMVMNALSSSDSAEKSGLLKKVAAFADGGTIDKVGSLLSGLTGKGGSGEEKTGDVLGALGGLFGKK